VAENLRKFNIRTIVLDPVMVAQSGDKLLQDEAIDALKQHLIPMAALITPNLPEASACSAATPLPMRPSNKRPLNWRPWVAPMC
jgi:Hydroxymethylpyrimidine/phosphomethylpyrimidine kinase